VSLLEIVAAALLTFGSLLLIRALIAADRAFPTADRTLAEHKPRASASQLRRAA
jgi:hypothetical protein